MTVGVGDAVDSVVVDDAVADASEGMAAVRGEETAEVGAGDEGLKSECNSVDASPNASHDADAASVSIAWEKFGSNQTGLTGSGFEASKWRKSSLELRTLSSRTGSSTTTGKKMFSQVELKKLSMLVQLPRTLGLWNLMGFES